MQKIHGSIPYIRWLPIIIVVETDGFIDISQVGDREREQIDSRAREKQSCTLFTAYP
jgi:hypothetical protein